MQTQTLEFIQDLLNGLVLVIDSRSAEIDPLDNKANGVPELSTLCQEVANILSANSRTRDKLPKRREFLTAMHKMVGDAYSDVVTKDGAPDMMFPIHTALLVGELRFLLRLLAVELQILPPSWAHPNSIAVKQFFREEQTI